MIFYFKLTKGRGESILKKNLTVSEEIMGYRIGVDLGGTNMAAGLLNEAYEIVCRKTIATREGGTPQELAEDMANLISDLLAEAKVAKEEILLVGIGIPGSVTEDGVVEDANNIGFFNVPFEAMMRERTGLRVQTINDARAAALGEYVAGAGVGSRSFQMLTIGTGVGGAFIFEGKVISGCNGAAGEIGHMVIRKDGVQCNCGRRGCLEAYASASALKKRMTEVVSEKQEGLLMQMCGGKPEVLSAKKLFAALAKEDRTAQELFEEYIEYLAEGVANLINALQPDVFCIGGGMSAQGEVLLAPLRRSVSEKIYSRHSAVQTQLVAAVLGNDAGIIGAAYDTK